jgi:hypothetical protein
LYSLRDLYETASNEHQGVARIIFSKDYRPRRKSTFANRGLFQKFSRNTGKQSILEKNGAHGLNNGESMTRCRIFR